MFLLIALLGLASSGAALMGQIGSQGAGAYFKGLGAILDNPGPVVQSHSALLFAVIFILLLKGIPFGVRLIMAPLGVVLLPYFMGWIAHFVTIPSWLTGGGAIAIPAACLIIYIVGRFKKHHK
ncbi:MAG: hypothetical protein J2P36_06895 [Ktedonobacteraceae bacterium]|nr:hypothetical protein [Ktedonobacteraceae bacterium]